MNLEFSIDAPMRSVIRTEADFLGVVGEVGQEVAGLSSDPMKWLLAHAQTNGSISLRLRGVPAHPDVPD